MEYKLTIKEKELITFLFEYRMEVEIDVKETETISYLKSINQDYFKMFESTNLYHSDERLTPLDCKIIDSLYKKFYN